jgi:hypothetical protein
VLRGDPAKQVQALKNQEGIVLTGSVSLAHTMIGVYPVVQGRGRPLFSAGTRPRLRLLGEPKSFPSGIVLLRYG